MIFRLGKIKKQNKTNTKKSKKLKNKFKIKTNNSKQTNKQTTLESLRSSNYVIYMPSVLKLLMTLEVTALHLYHPLSATTPVTILNDSLHCKMLHHDPVDLLASNNCLSLYSLDNHNHALKFTLINNRTISISLSFKYPTLWVLPFLIPA